MSPNPPKPPISPKNPSKPPLGRLKVFEGVPAVYETRKKVVIPDALKVIRMKSYRKFCLLGDLSASVGWSKQTLVDRLEEKRKERSLNWYKKQVEEQNRKRKAINVAKSRKSRTSLHSSASEEASQFRNYRVEA